MKRTVKILSALLLALALLSMSVSAFAAGLVYWDHDTPMYITPGTDYHATDLFENFKDVMPGDVRTQEIWVHNLSDDYKYVSLFLRAVAHDEGENPLEYSEPYENLDGKDQANVAGERDETVATMRDFLHQLSMRVYNGEELIFEASADELDGLEERVKIADLYQKETVLLTVELIVPIEMGNEYANRVGEVDWIFTTQAYQQLKPTFPDPTAPGKTLTPVTTPAPGAQPVLPPKTGDDTNILGYVLIGLAAAVILTAALMLLKRSAKNKE